MFYTRIYIIENSNYEKYFAEIGRLLDNHYKALATYFNAFTYVFNRAAYKSSLSKWLFGPSVVQLCLLENLL